LWLTLYLEQSLYSNVLGSAILAAQLRSAPRLDPEKSDMLRSEAMSLSPASDPSLPNFPKGRLRSRPRNGRPNILKPDRLDLAEGAPKRGDS
jgi:hypothetical protein